MSLPSLLLSILLFFGLIFGLGLPWVAAWMFSSVEKLAIGAACGVVQIYGFAWVVYGLSLPPTAFFALPLLAIIVSWIRRRRLAVFLGESDIRSLLGRHLLFTAWCVGFLTLVRSYGGGEWGPDWNEHYQRALFFLQHQPLETRFCDVYTLPARPPLANLVTGACMAMTGTDFAHFQVFNTLFSTLLFLPAILLTRHFSAGGVHGDAGLLLIFMLNPLVLQNSTFAWTKFLTAFFVLLAVAIYVRGLGEAAPERRILAAGLMAAAILTHYSSGPFAVGLAATQLVLAWSHRGQRSMGRELLLQALLAGAVLASWFAWSVARYGLHETFLSNPTATVDSSLSPLTWVERRLSNIFVTFIPHPFHPVDYRFIAQTSSIGYVRDYCFNIYQTTLPGAFGTAGLVLLSWKLLYRDPPAAMPTEQRFWNWFPAGVILLGIMTASWLDRWGVAHICLSALVVIGLAWCAARLPTAPAAVRHLWMAALGIDATLGIAIHFYLQGIIRPDFTMLPFINTGTVFPYGLVTTKNILLKSILGYNFVADGGPAPPLVITLLVMLLVLATKQALSSFRPAR